MHVGRNLDAGDLAKGFRKVDRGHYVLVASAGLGDAGPAYDHRRAERLLIDPAFVEPAVLSEIETLVGTVDHDGVLVQSLLFQVGQHAAHVVVHRGDATQVILDVTLVLPANQILALQVGLGQGRVLGIVGSIPKLSLLRREVAGGSQLEVTLGHGLGNRHVLLVGGQSPPLVVIEERVRFGQGDVVVFGQVFRPRLPITVRRLVLEHQHERLRLVSFVLHPVQGQVGDNVRRVAHVIDSSVLLSVAIRILEHGRIVVGSLANQHFRVIVSLRRHVRAQVPLADHRGGVACLAQKLGKGLLGTVELVAIDQETIGVRVLAGLDRGPHRPADRISNVALLEKHAIPGQRIDVGRGAMLLEP